MAELVRATFLMETHLGHRTYYQNLRRSIEANPQVCANWVEITYKQPESYLEKLPLLPDRLRGPLIGRSQVMQSLASKLDYDVAFFNTQAPAALAFEKIKQKPYIICTDITPLQYDVFAAEYNHHVDQWKFVQQYKHQVITKLFQSAAFVLPWSNWVRSSLITDYGVQPERAIVIPPGIDVNVWKPQTGGNKSRFRILFVGGDFYRKGGPFLLEAFHKLPAGSCELSIVTKSDVPAQEGVIVHKNMSPNTPELIELYQSCDAFVFPTQAEAFGIAAIEAAAVGLPVITSCVGGLGDIVIDKETGFLLPKNDLSAFVEAILLLIENHALCEKMSCAAREHTLNHFDAAKNAVLIQQLLIQAAHA